MWNSFRSRCPSPESANLATPVSKRPSAPSGQNGHPLCSSKSRRRRHRRTGSCRCIDRTPNSAAATTRKDRRGKDCRDSQLLQLPPPPVCPTLPSWIWPFSFSGLLLRLLPTRTSTFRNFRWPAVANDPMWEVAIASAATRHGLGRQSCRCRCQAARHRRLEGGCRVGPDQIWDRGRKGIEEGTDRWGRLLEARWKLKIVCPAEVPFDLVPGAPTRWSRSLSSSRETATTTTVTWNGLKLKWKAVAGLGPVHRRGPRSRSRSSCPDRAPSWSEWTGASGREAWAGLCLLAAAAGRRSRGRMTRWRPPNDAWGEARRRDWLRHHSTRRGRRSLRTGPKRTGGRGRRVGGCRVVGFRVGCWWCVGVRVMKGHHCKTGRLSLGGGGGWQPRPLLDKLKGTKKSCWKCLC